MVVQVDLDGRMTPRYGVRGILPISLQVQRTIQRADTWALCRLCASSAIFSDYRGAVQALHKCEVDCISAGHKDADLWFMYGAG